MCTLLTVSYDFFANNRQALMQRIAWDAASNSDGGSLLLSHYDGSCSNLRTMDLDTLVTVLDTVGWERMWLHQRNATQGEAALHNTHGFCTAGVWYMHNGVIRSPEARSLPVDSMVIGRWLQRGNHYTKLAQEPFANVFFIAPDQNVYTVVRSSGGALHTDGLGNYSTIPVAEITQAVPTGVETYWIDEADAPEADVEQPTLPPELDDADDKYTLDDGTPVCTYPWARWGGSFGE